MGRGVVGPGALGTGPRADDVAPAPAPSAPASAGSARDQVVEALLGLGFPARAAEQAVDAVLAENGATTTSAALRAALSHLGRSR